MTDVIDIDPSLRALDALADDFAEPGPAGAGCAQAWPLLAVPADELSPLDLDARDHHLARCARCRVAFAEDALDPIADRVTARAEALPVATVLPTLPAPSRRRRRTAIAMGAGLCASAAAAIAISAAGGSHAAGRPPVDLVVLADGSAFAEPELHTFDNTMKTMQLMLREGSRVQLVAASGKQVHVVWNGVITEHDHLLHDVAPRSSEPPDYAAVFDAVPGLFTPGSGRHALLIVGNLCAGHTRESDAALARLHIPVEAVGFRDSSASCSLWKLVDRWANAADSDTFTNELLDSSERLTKDASDPFFSPRAAAP